MKAIFMGGTGHKKKGNRECGGYLTEKDDVVPSPSNLLNLVEQGEGYKIKVHEEPDCVRVELEYQDDGRGMEECLKIGPEILEEHEALRNAQDASADPHPMPQGSVNRDEVLRVYGEYTLDQLEVNLDSESVEDNFEEEEIDRMVNFGVDKGYLDPENRGR